MSGRNKLIIAVIVLGAVWFIWGDQIKEHLHLGPSGGHFSSTASGDSAQGDGNRVYWEKFWALYPEGDGFGSRDDLENLPIEDVTDPLLENLHNICVRYFDELDENQDKKDAGEKYLTKDMIRGHWAADFMPILKRLKDKYGTPNR